MDHVIGFVDGVDACSAGTEGCWSLWLTDFRKSMRLRNLVLCRLSLLRLLAGSVELDCEVFKPTLEVSTRVCSKPVPIDENSLLTTRARDHLPCMDATTLADLLSLSHSERSLPAPSERPNPTCEVNAWSVGAEHCNKKLAS